jgi:hypothetical protein
MARDSHKQSSCSKHRQKNNMIWLSSTSCGLILRNVHVLCCHLCNWIFKLAMQQCWCSIDTTYRCCENRANHISYNCFSNNWLPTTHTTSHDESFGYSWSSRTILMNELFVEYHTHLIMLTHLLYVGSAQTIYLSELYVVLCTHM